MKRFVTGVVAGLLVSSALVGGAYATGLATSGANNDQTITRRDAIASQSESRWDVELSDSSVGTPCSGPSDDGTVEVCAYVPEVDPIRRTVARFLVALAGLASP